jgi:hypothetical protein
LPLGSPHLFLNPPHKYDRGFGLLLLLLLQSIV